MQVGAEVECVAGWGRRAALYWAQGQQRLTIGVGHGIQGPGLLPAHQNLHRLTPTWHASPVPSPPSRWPPPPARQVLPPEEPLVEMKATDLLARRPALSLVALVAILDPPREEAIAAVKVAHKAGISVKMITGERRGCGCRAGLPCGHDGQHTHRVVC